jgi:protein-S-isoprenylcysteine O-methyltransferase Ste14
MYYFLIPLLFGFICNLASAFTTSFSRRWGERRGSYVSVILRDILGIPVWAIGFVLAARHSSPALFPVTMMTTTLGWLSILAGGTIIVIALAAIRSRAARPSIRDDLAQVGIYAHVRHPIHTGTLLEFAGLVLVKPTLPIALASGLGVIWVLFQTRFEEIDLLQRLPSYREYMITVPRFLPRFRRK